MPQPLPPIQPLCCRSCAVRLQELEATWTERLSAAAAAAAAQLDQAQQRHSLELARAAEAATLQGAEAEARWGRVWVESTLSGGGRGARQMLYSSSRSCMACVFGTSIASARQQRVAVTYVSNATARAVLSLVCAVLYHPVAPPPLPLPCVSGGASSWMTCGGAGVPSRRPATRPGRQSWRNSTTSGSR